MKRGTPTKRVTRAQAKRFVLAAVDATDGDIGALKALLTIVRAMKRIEKRQEQRMARKGAQR